MKVFLIGGTGLLGSEAARVLMSRGHQVSSLALPPIPKGADLPGGMKLSFGNYLTLTDDQLREHLRGCDGFVFAAGVDERVEGPAPIYDLYEKFNIKPLERILRLAKEEGVNHAVVCGSYFAYFNKVKPELHLAEDHPYIRSRMVQEEMALSFAKEGMDVAVLELPYIFGAQQGRKPVWVFLVEMIKKMKRTTYWCQGGTAMVTVRQVGEAIAGALENNVGGKTYPIGWFNLTWSEMLKLFHKHMGEENKKIRIIPTWIFKMAMKKVEKEQRAKGIDGGLKMVKFTEAMTSQFFIEKELGCLDLGVTYDDIDAAIGSSVQLSLEALEKKTDMVAMKGE